MKPHGERVAVQRTSSELVTMANDTEAEGDVSSASHLVTGTSYRLYKRRFFGLAQLVLLNIIISWDWLTYAPISANAAQWLSVSQDAINWLSIGFFFAFTAISPVVLWTLNKGGPSLSIRIASVLVLIGNWIRYKGAIIQQGAFAVTMVGQILIGLAQPFVLSAPARYANLWFSDTGRVTAIAVASLANPLGGALGQLISPIWAPNPQDIPNMVLWTAVMASVISVAGFATHSQPPTPPSSIAASEKLDLRHALKELPKVRPFWWLAVPFVVYVGLFNAVSSLLNQILEPYGFSDEDAGIAGALLIVVGLVAAAICSPIVDRTKSFLLAINSLVPLIAICYVILVFMPQTRSLAGPYVVCSLLGAASFSLLPCALEYLAQVTHPISAEISSTICWALAQLFGAIFTLIMNALKASNEADPPQNMYKSLVFQACIACVAAPFPYLIWYSRRGGREQNIHL